MSELVSPQVSKANGQLSDSSLEEILQLVNNSSSKQLQLNWMIKQLEQKIYLERKLNEISLKYNNLLVDYDQFKFEAKKRDKVLKKSKTQSKKKSCKMSHLALIENLKTISADIRKIYRMISSNLVVKSSTSSVSVQTDFAENVIESNQIDIFEHDFNKKCIRLANKTDFEIEIGNFQLISYLNGFEIANFKFHKSAYLKAKSSMTVWSSYSSFKKHYPPNDFEMENDQMNDENINKLLSILNNFAGDVWDVLLDTNNNEIARTEFTIKIKEKIH